MRCVDQRAHRWYVALVAARDQRRAEIGQPLCLRLVARYGQESHRHQCRMGQHHRMGLRHVVEPDVRDRSEPCRVFQYDAGVRGVQMHMERIAAPLDDDEAGFFLQKPFDFLLVRLRNLQAEGQAVRVNDVMARVGQSRRLFPCADGKVQGRGDEISIQPLLAADQERQHNLLAHVQLRFFPAGTFPRFDGRREDFRDGQVCADGLIGALRHGAGRVDDWTFRLLRQYALGVEDTVLECFAEFRRGRVDFSAQSFGKPPQNLGQYDAGVPPRAENCRRRHAAGEPADAVVLRPREGHDCRTHRAQDIRARMRIVLRTKLPIEFVDVFIFQQKFAVRAGNHAFEITARNDFPVCAHASFNS